MATRDAAAQPLRLRASRRRWGEDVVKGVLALCALVSVATTVGIVVALFVPAIEFFGEISIVDFLSGTEWAPLFEPASLRRPAARRRHVPRRRCASLVCIPFGLGAAIYMSEYARPRARKCLKPALEVLAGIPPSSTAISRSPS